MRDVILFYPTETGNELKVFGDVRDMSQFIVDEDIDPKECRAFVGEQRHIMKFTGSPDQKYKLGRMTEKDRNKGKCYGRK